MTDAASIEILQDLTCIAGLALFLGLVGYRLMRLLRPTAAWNHDGLVVSRPYADQDLVVMTAGLALLLMSIMAPAPVPAAPVADALPDGGSIILGMLPNLFLCALLLIYLNQIRGLNPAELFGLNLIRRGRVLRTAALFFLPMLFVVGVVAYFTERWLREVAPGVEKQDLVQIFLSADGLEVRALIIIAAVVVAPIAEETLFRGFIYGVLKRYTDGPFAAIISAMFFAIIHMHVGSLVPLWVLALVLCAAYEMTGCLLVPMLLHSAFNSTSIVLMLIGAGQPSP